MRWPWTSRARLDDAFAEIAYLRQQNADLLDHVQRMDRLRHGTTEIPRVPRPALEPMPPSLTSYFDRLDNRVLAQERRRQCYRRHGHGEPWEKIARDVLPPPEPTEVEKVTT